MRNMLRVLTASAMIAGLLGLAPGARADDNYVESTPCDSTIYVFNGYGVSAEGQNLRRSPATIEAACLAVTDGDGIDPRIIYPGTTSLSVRVTFTVPEDAESVFGRVYLPDGEVVEIELIPSTLIDGSCCLLDSQSIEIDPAASGYYRVEVDLPLDESTFLTYADEYRTAGQPSRAPGFIP